MGAITTIPGRSGFYIRVAVPNPLRKVMGTSAVVRKAGKTHAEALKNRTRIVLEIDKLFQDKRGLDPIGQQFEQDGGPDVDGIVLIHLEQRLKSVGLTDDQINSVLYSREELEKPGLPDQPQPKLPQQLEASLSGSSSYLTWIDRRLKAEAPAATTELSWRGRLRRLADWYGSDHLAGINRKQAAAYKDHLLAQKKPSSVKTELGTMLAFWTWAIDAGEVQINVWSGLKKKLKESTKDDALAPELVQQAKVKALQLKDLGFFLQLYTGCRAMDHQGLRYSDIDMSELSIRLIEWQTETIERRLKGGEKDVRKVPICMKLKAVLEELLPDVVKNTSDELIFPKSYDPSLKLFSHRWTVNCKKRYAIKSHAIRSHVITQLGAKNISPCLLYEITRHTQTGMPKVVMGWTRPSWSDVAAVMELLD